MNTLNPLEKNTRVFPLTVPGAFRAWSAWANTQGCGCLQVVGVQSAFAGREHAERDALLVALCEVYSRAVNECAIALHFSRTDSEVDVHVATQIGQLFDWGIAELVHSMVGDAGPVVREWSAITRLALAAGAMAGPEREPA